MKNWEGRHTHTYKINVLAKPIPEVQTITAVNKSDIDVFFPQDITYHSIVSSGSVIFEEIETFSDRYRFHLQGLGRYTLSFRDVNNFDVVVIHMDIIPMIHSVIVPKGYRHEMGQFSTYTRDIIGSGII